jgi:hypothetical protein
MPSVAVALIGTLGAAYAFLFALLHFTQDPREPPVVEAAIPFLSPLKGQLSGMQKYFVALRYVGPVYFTWTSEPS